jgi:hypothetical protein
MKNWVRVAAISSVLIGGTVFFAYQSLNQFNSTLNNLSASYIAIAVANTRSLALSDKMNREQISTTTLETISTTTPQDISTSSPIIISTAATSTEVKLSLVFPPKSNDVYTGCTYQIPLQSSTTIRSLKTALIDAGTRETIGPIASGLAKEDINIEKGSQNLKWKIGAVWSGTYYIKVSNINGTAAEIQSKVFQINKMSADITTDEQKNICKKSGGLL